MMNHVSIMGNLVANPELRTTQSGTKVASFRIAVGRDYAAKGAERETDFFDCVAWRATGEFVVRNFSKGMPIAISGRLSSRNWEDKDGRKRVSIEIIAEDVYFAGGSRAARSSEATFTELDNDDGELPWNEDDALPL